MGRGRPINPESIQHSEQGTTTIRIGRETYTRLLQIAKDDSISATVSRLVKQELEGTQGELIDTAPPPVTKKDIEEMRESIAKIDNKVMDINSNLWLAGDRSLKDEIKLMGALIYVMAGFMGIDIDSALNRVKRPFPGFEVQAETI